MPVFCEAINGSVVRARRPTSQHPHACALADFAYAWTAEDWLYLAVVLDLYSRRAVGLSMQASVLSQLVAHALVMASFPSPQSLKPSTRRSASGSPGSLSSPSARPEGLA